MSTFKIYVKYSVVIEEEVFDVDAESEFDALNKAFEKEEYILEDLHKKHGESVEFEEFVAVKK